MKQTSLNVLLQSLINGNIYDNILVRDGDGFFHRVNVIDIYNSEIKCKDGYYHYFEAFKDDGNHELYIE